MSLAILMNMGFAGSGVSIVARASRLLTMGVSCLAVLLVSVSCQI